MLDNFGTFLFLAFPLRRIYWSKKCPADLNRIIYAEWADSDRSLRDISFRQFTTLLNFLGWNRVCLNTDWFHLFVRCLIILVFGFLTNFIIQLIRKADPTPARAWGRDKMLLYRLLCATTTTSPRHTSTPTHSSHVAATRRAFITELLGVMIIAESSFFIKVIVYGSLHDSVSICTTQMHSWWGLIV